MNDEASTRAIRRCYVHASRKTVVAGEVMVELAADVTMTGHGMTGH